MKIVIPATPIPHIPPSTRKSFGIHLKGRRMLKGCKPKNIRYSTCFWTVSDNTGRSKFMTETAVLGAKLASWAHHPCPRIKNCWNHQPAIIGDSYRFVTWFDTHSIHMISPFRLKSPF